MLASGSSGLVVLLASVLKPVDDARMRGKFAETLRARPGTRVHVAGRRAGANDSDDFGVGLHPIFSGSRLSLGRLGAQWRYWRLLRRLRPALVIVHAPELLPPTLLWQRLGRGRTFIYDIRENYALNITTQDVYRGGVRRWLAAGVRWVETRAARRAGGLTLAEASYVNELPFLRELPADRVVVLENKYQPAPDEQLPTQPRPRPAPGEPLRLLYSGTISELNGIHEAVELMEALNRMRPDGAVLTVIGFCQQPILLKHLESWATRGGALRIVGGAEPVPHADIVAEIKRSHLGLALYRPHPSTERCRPTKLFEYLAHGLPVLFSQNPLWEDLVKQHDAGLSFDVVMTEAADEEELLAALDARAADPDPGFYRTGVPTDVLWAAEGKKLWHLLDSLD